ncbi:hypothetical protein P168DRAFT_335663 [Aspergillus campestris IBT 28561]|uniref:Uncharacterized protein n=1 Tax=Aspergillus campestris (strain IBT 28561) TaxID=1392248 RepID=A0A2I1CT35_ASPC2|nr:uncharacterized protein P168DRAFT_335663 [Aspergillus campestris IBT 28561]PKY00775.1 hypothetical protein P168DRAFT_335663 [Aspergillus campestris IBT 28561]
MLLFRPLKRTSSNRFKAVAAPLKLSRYPFSTSSKNCSVWGCVLPNARSRTYRSTARSSSCALCAARPKSINTTSPSISTCPSSSASSSDSPLGGPSGLNIKLLVVRSPCTTPARCSAPTETPILLIRSRTRSSSPLSTIPQPHEQVSPTSQAQPSQPAHQPTPSTTKRPQHRSPPHEHCPRPDPPSQAPAKREQGRPRGRASRDSALPAGCVGG